MFRGFWRCELGDLDGIADLEQGLSDALELGGAGAVSAHVNLAGQVWRQQGPRAALELYESAIDYAQRRGVTPGWAQAESCWMLYDLGEWEELTRREHEIRGRADARGTRAQPYYMATTYGAQVLRWRGELADAAALMADILPGAREVEDPQVLGPALVASALIEEALGDLPSAKGRIEEWHTVTRDRPYFRAQSLTDAVRIACTSGDTALAERLREGVITAAERDRLSDLTAQAVIAEARGEAAAAAAAYREAASAWSDFGCVFEHGLALLGLGRCTATREPVEEARAVFVRLGAPPLVTESDELLRRDRSATAG
jgi:hypothetical protein